VPGTPGVTNGHAATLDEAEAKFRAAWGQDETGSCLTLSSTKRELHFLDNRVSGPVTFMFAAVVLHRRRHDNGGPR
jgi:hypothetical protein